MDDVSVSRLVGAVGECVPALYATFMESGRRRRVLDPDARVTVAWRTLGMHGHADIEAGPNHGRSLPDVSPGQPGTGGYRRGLRARHQGDAVAGQGAAPRCRTGLPVAAASLCCQRRTTIFRGTYMRRLLCLLAVASLLAACGGPTTRYAAAPVPSGNRIGISVSRLEVREVSLPTYAQTEEIWTEIDGGALRSSARTLWADEPSRGITQELSQHLSSLTGARVAAEPWPFEDLPQARLVVRVGEMVAGVDGNFRLAGQYYVASDSGRRDRSGDFRVSAPIAPDSGAQGIAAARAIAVRDLARLIASRGI
ncbi:PqiC family protein [Tropicimonas marinistellae]|uniref:PqiC family protein n=1 Tax=Tropicimonas marinistellae TaxID=1739787 RepID=UPI000A8B185D|nr:ABC-type transport auxiliary lipoprotein family protein [Tropicimonas marinistellae]